MARVKNGWQLSQSTRGFAGGMKTLAPACPQERLDLPHLFPT